MWLLDEVAQIRHISNLCEPSPLLGRMFECNDLLVD